MERKSRSGEVIAQIKRAGNQDEIVEETNVSYQKFLIEPNNSVPMKMMAIGTGESDNLSKFS